MLMMDDRLFVYIYSANLFRIKTNVNYDDN